MLLGNEELFVDSFAVLSGERHQDIGKFIAHHWSELSEFYQGRIYSVYDTTDNDEGRYMKIRVYHVTNRIERRVY